MLLRISLMIALSRFYNIFMSKKKCGVYYESSEINTTKKTFVIQYPFVLSVSSSIIFREAIKS